MMRVLNRSPAHSGIIISEMIVNFLLQKKKFFVKLMLIYEVCSGFSSGELVVLQKML
jgi:hypothetical protein